MNIQNNLYFNDKIIYDIIQQEEERQSNVLELIASENIVSPAVREAMSSVLTNKYAEGYPYHRYYGGCEFVDKIEQIAINRTKDLFKCEHANVQPHSGSNANLTVYNAVLNSGDTFMGMSLSNGGHLTHGSKVNFSGKFYNCIQYGVNPITELIDYEAMEKLALQCRPKLIVAGASAYPRNIDFERIRYICDKVDALMMVDIAHIAGLVATYLHQSPVPYADFVTTTTHKTLRGPRGGIVMCKSKYSKIIDKSLFPGLQGGPLMHVIASKAVALKEALSPEFKVYQKQVISNAKELACSLMNLGYRLVTGGTDNHMMIIDLRNHNITGKEAEKLLENNNIAVNKNSIPNDVQKPTVTSGIRIGTPAVTTLGMKEDEMKYIANLIDSSICSKNVKLEVIELCKMFRRTSYC